MRQTSTPTRAIDGSRARVESSGFDSTRAPDRRLRRLRRLRSTGRSSERQRARRFESKFFPHPSFATRPTTRLRARETDAKRKACDRWCRATEDAIGGVERRGTRFIRSSQSNSFLRPSWRLFDFDSDESGCWCRTERRSANTSGVTVKTRSV